MSKYVEVGDRVFHRACRCKDGKHKGCAGHRVASVRTDSLYVGGQAVTVEPDPMIEQEDETVRRDGGEWAAYWFIKRGAVSAHRGNA